MKKYFLLFGLLFVCRLLSANCPPGYAPVGINTYVVAQYECPAGYIAITNKTLTPDGGFCDTAKGACSAAGACQVP